MQREMVQAHEIVVDPQVLRLLNESEVTVNEYKLLHYGSLLVDSARDLNNLTEPFFDKREFEYADPEDRPTPEEMRQLFADARAEFFDEYVEPIVAAKKAPLSRIDKVDLDRLEADVGDTAEVLSDLKALGVNRDRMSVWQFVTAYKAGENMLYELTSPPHLGVLFATGAAVTKNDTQWNDWETVALYSLGKALYSQLEMRDTSFYSNAGVKTVTKNMREYVYKIMAEDTQTTAIHRRILADRNRVSETVKHYVSLLNTQRSEKYQPYPKTAHSKINVALEKQGVSWDDLMFSFGQSVLLEYHPSTFGYDWFANIAVGHIRDIAAKKQKKASIDFSSVAGVFGYNPKHLVLSEWELEMLKYTFSTPELEHWEMVRRVASIPWLIPSYSYEKSLLYFCYSLSVGHAKGRYEKGIEQIRQNPNSFHKIYAELIRQNIADMPRFRDEAKKMMRTPEIAQIFAEVLSGLSIEVTRNRIEQAIRQQKRIVP